MLLFLLAYVLAAMRQIFKVPTFVMALVEHGSVGFLLANEILTKLRAALINGNGMSYHFSGTSGCVREFAALHPGVFELRNAVDCVEEAEEADWADWAAESFSKGAHIF